MATQLQIRRGTTAQMNAFTGAEGEIAVNTSTDTVHVHDGSTAGGFALAKADGSNIATYAGSFTTLAASGAVTLSSTLTVSGNVGIGGAPSKPLHVFGADGAGEGTPSFNANTVSIFQNNGASGDDSILNIIAGSASSGIVAFGDSADSIRQAVVANMSNDSLELRTGNNSTALTIDSSGNVGIGVSNPSDYYANNLVVTGPSEGGITIASTGNHTNYLLFADSTSGVARYAGMIEYAHSIDQMAFRTNSIQRMAIDSAGRVGIGTSLPSYLIHADAVTSTDPSYLVASSGSDFVVAMGSQNSPGVAQEAFIGTISNDTLKIKTNNTEAFRITAARDMYFGQTSGSAADAGHIMQANGVMFHTADATTGMYLRRLNSDGSILEFRKDSTTVGSLLTNGGRFAFIGTKGGVSAGFDFEANTKALRPVNGSGTSSDNTHDIGRADVRWKDIRATNGTIQTSDRNEKQDIETLSDAEQRVAVAAKGLMRKFRWIDAVETKGDNARIHFGIIAQDLQDAFTAEGLDAARYAMFCSDTWTNDDGSEQTRLGVRYSELLAFIISAI